MGNTPSVFRRNLGFNLLGTFWSALMQFAFVPIYLRLLGIEAFGLIAFSVTLQTMLQVFDLGLSPAMNREMARLSVSADYPSEPRDFVRTIEIGYWLFGLFMGGVIALVAPVISSSWIKAGSLETKVVTHAVMLMGIMTAFQWPLSLYQGGLLGLQRQGALNAINIAMSTLQNAGAVLLLIYVSPTITIFFGWRAVATLLQVLCTTFVLWRNLPPSDQPARFRPRAFRATWKFAAGMSGITLSGMMLSQADKLLLSKLLPLAEYGYYMLATTVATALTMLSSPIYNAAFPQFSACVAIHDENALRSTYHLNTQLMAVIVLPLAMVFIFFSHDILRLWTGNATTTTATAPLLTVLAAGTAINGLMYVPYALQLAYGCTSLGLAITTAFLVTLVPLVILMAIFVGPLGVAGVWVVLNTIYMLVGVPLTHRTMLPGQAKQWFRNVIPVMGICLLIGTIAVFLIGTDWSTMQTLLFLSAFVVLSYLAAALVSDRIRSYIFGKLGRYYFA
jgi:O-antigen/teichoic acid export membrane protein